MGVSRRDPKNWLPQYLVLGTDPVRIRPHGRHAMLVVGRNLTHCDLEYQPSHAASGGIQVYRPFRSHGFGLPLKNTILGWLCQPGPSLAMQGDFGP